MKNFLTCYTCFPVFLNRIPWIYSNVSLLPKDCHSEGLIIKYDDVFQLPHFGFSVLPIKNRPTAVTSPFATAAMCSSVLQPKNKINDAQNNFLVPSPPIPISPQNTQPTAKHHSSFLHLRVMCTRSHVGGT